MLEPKHRALERSGYILVLLMAVLQGGYAIFAYVDPAAFSILGGTELLDVGYLFCTASYRQKKTVTGHARAPGVFIRSCSLRRISNGSVLPR